MFNAANEECVDAFLAGRLPFNGIMDTVTEVVEEHGTPAAGTSLTVRGRPRSGDLGTRPGPELAEQVSEDGQRRLAHDDLC